MHGRIGALAVGSWWLIVDRAHRPAAAALVGSRVPRDRNPKQRDNANFLRWEQKSPA